MTDIPQVIKDYKAGITPYERQLIEQSKQTAPKTVSPSKEAAIKAKLSTSGYKEYSTSPIPTKEPVVKDTQKGLLSIKETVWKEADVAPTPAVTPTTQVVQDFKKDITPIERQIVEQKPESKLSRAQEFSSEVEGRPIREILPFKREETPAPKPPSVEDRPKYVSGQEIRVETLKDLSSRLQPYKDIDTSVQYKVEGMEGPVSGTELQSMYAKELKQDIKETLSGVAQVKPGLYVEEEGQPYKIPEAVMPMGAEAHKKYGRVVSDYQKGHITEEQVQKKVGEIQEVALSKMPDSRHLDWIKEHGTFTDDSGNAVPWSTLEEEGFRMRVKNGKADIYVPSEYELGKEAYDTLIKQYTKVTGGDRERAKRLVDVRLGSVALMESPLGMDTFLEAVEIQEKKDFLSDYQRGLETGRWNTPYQFAVAKEKFTRPGPIVGAIQNLLGQGATKRERIKAIEETLKDYMYTNKPSQQSTLYSLAMKDLGYKSALDKDLKEYALKVGTSGAMVEGVIIPSVTFGVGTAIGGATSVFGGRIAGALGKGVSKITPTISKTISKLGPKASTIISKSVSATTKVAPKAIGRGALAGFGAMSAADVYMGSMPRTEMFQTPEGLMYTGERGGVRGGVERGFAQTMMWGGMLSGAKLGAKYGSKYKELTTPPSDMPKDVSGFRRLDPDKAKALWRKQVLKAHPDKPIGKSEEFIRVHEAYKAYGTDPKVTRIQDIKSILAGRNIYVRPGVWHRFTPETVTEFGGLLASGKVPVKPRTQLSFPGESPYTTPLSKEAMSEALMISKPKLAVFTPGGTTPVSVPGSLQINLDTFVPGLSEYPAWHPGKEIVGSRVMGGELVPRYGFEKAPSFEQLQTHLASTKGLSTDLYARDYFSGKRIDFLHGEPLETRQSVIERFSLEEPQLTPGKRISSGKRVKYKQYQKDLSKVKSLEEKIVTHPKQVIEQEYSQMLRDWKTKSKTLSKWEKARISAQKGSARAIKGRKPRGISQRELEAIQQRKKFNIELSQSKIKKPDFTPPEDFIIHQTIDVDKGLAKETFVTKLGKKKVSGEHITLKVFEKPVPKFKVQGTPGQEAILIPRTEPVLSPTKLKTKVITKKVGRTRKISKPKKKKVTGVKDEYVQEYVPRTDYVSKVDKTALTEGPGSPFGKLAKKKSGWGGISLKDLEELEAGIYSGEVHEHWKDVAPSIKKYTKPSIYQGEKGKLSILQGGSKLPIYTKGIDIGVVPIARKLPDSITGDIGSTKPILGELPGLGRETLSREDIGTRYDVGPVYSPITDTDVTPKLGEDVIQDTIVDTTTVYGPNLIPPELVPYYDPYVPDTPKPREPKPGIPDLPEDLEKKKLPTKIFRKRKYRTGYKERTYDVKDIWHLTKFKKPKYFSLSKKR